MWFDMAGCLRWSKFWLLIVFMLILEVQTTKEDTGRFVGLELGIIERKSKRVCCETSFASVAVNEYGPVVAAEHLE